MRKILVVIDMQNDFIDGALGTAEALAIVDNVKAKIRSYAATDVFATRDTHQADYLNTQEGKNLPVQHCIAGSGGWQIRPDIAALLDGAVIFDKPTFGSVELARHLASLNAGEPLEIEIVKKKEMKK
jgi:nicotinamidase-related amidase